MNNEWMKNFKKGFVRYRYVKQFTSGTLKGLEVPCFLQCDKSLASEYLVKLAPGQTGSDCLTGATYVITALSQVLAYKVIPQ